MEREDNRVVTVNTGGLADLDAALAWVVQRIEAERLATPSITISAYLVLSGDDEGVTLYEASVSGESQS